MRKLSGKIGIAFAAFYLMLCSVGSADYPTEIEISTKQKHIKVGEPLIIKLTYRFEQPQFSPRVDKVFTAIGPNAIVQIKKNDEEILSPGHHLGPDDLYLQDTEGLKYTGDFLFFYDFFKKKLVFDKPGIYTITVRRTRTKISNSLSITVEPAKDLHKRALSLLSDPNDYFFLEHGEHEYREKRPERISHLQQVVDRCEGTVLAKWAAARLGLEYFEEFHKKHPSFEKFKAKHQQGQIEEPLFDQARKYLAAGARLADEFPIREKILYQLTRTEAIRGNYEKAFSLLDELGAKYSKGEYGKRASSAKAELQKLKERELEESPKSLLGQAWRSAILPVVAAAAVGIVVIGLILVLKKKTSSRGKSRAT